MKRELNIEQTIVEVIRKGRKDDLDIWVDANKRNTSQWHTKVSLLAYTRENNSPQEMVIPDQIRLGRPTTDGLAQHNQR